MPGFKCDCLEVMSAKLAEHNTKICVTMAFPRDGTPGYVLPKIDKEKVERRKRDGPALAIPSFCPFCGIAAGIEPAAVRAAADQVEALRQFALWAIREGPFQGYDLDGPAVQDRAVELGLLAPAAYDPAIHGEAGFEDVEPGCEIFVFAGAAAEKGPAGE